jgi:hypothetical protein
MPEQPTRDPVTDLIENTLRETQDLTGVLCQVQGDRVHELVSRDLREQVAHILDERFSQLEAAVRPRMARARLEVARGITLVLNECFTRMRRFESDRSWCEAMLDAAGALCRRCAFFSVRGENLCLQSARSLDPHAHFPPSEVPYATAPAFHRVITSGKTHSVVRSAAELSLPIAAMFGSDTEARALLVPVSTADRVPGIIYAEDAVDASAIEVVAALAGSVLEKHLRLFEPIRSAGGRVRSVAVAGMDRPLPPPQRAGDQELTASAPPQPEDPAQIAAERFARVEVARLLLTHTPAISEGRRHRNLYSAMQAQIDAARARYRKRFDGVPDYLHAEIVRTLALNDAALLGRDYPGPIS